MAAANLKLKVVLDAKDLSSLPDAVQKANEKVKAVNTKAQSDAQKADSDHQDKLQRQRIAMQRASLSLEERVEKQRAAMMERNNRITLQATQTRADAVTRIERQAAIAQAALVLDKFDRRIAIEKVKHTQILADLKGSDAATEAEVRRHQAVVGRIQMDQANFANTPFQKMLENFNKLNQGLGKFTPIISTAATATGTMAGTLGTAAGAAGAFGGALSSLAMGPIGIAIAGVTALSAGVNMLIDSADQAATLKGDLGKTMQDPAKLDALLKSMERFEAARGKRGGGAVAASKEVQAIAGQSADELASLGLDAAGLRRLQVAQKKRLEYLRTHNEDAKRLDRDLAEAQVALIPNETARLLASEEIQYKAEIKALAGHKENLEKEEKLHGLNVKKIRMDASEQAANAAADEAIQAFKNQMAIEHKLGKQANTDRDEAIAADEKRTEEIYKRRALSEEKAQKAKQSLAEVKAMSPSEALEAQHQKELSEYEGFKAEQAKIDEKYRILKDRLDKQAHLSELQAGADLLGNLGNLLQAASGKNKAMAKAGMRLTEASAIASTAAGVAKAFEQGGVLGFVTGGSIALAGAAQVATIEQQIGKFAGGGIVPGSRTSGDHVPALVNSGEMILNQDQQATLFAMANGRGGGGPSLHAPITINLSGAATPGDAEMVGAAVETRLRTLMKDIKRAEYLGIKG